MKKFVAIALVLVLVLSLCATAFADYYPTAAFKASSKNKVIKYGKTLTLRYIVKQGTGPFNRVKGTNGKWIYRAGMTVYAIKGSAKQKIEDIDFTGNGTIVEDYKTKKYFAQPKKNKTNTYNLYLTSWYRPTKNYTVYAFKQYKTVNTKLYVWR